MEKWLLAILIIVLIAILGLVIPFKFLASNQGPRNNETNINTSTMSLNISLEASIPSFPSFISFTEPAVVKNSPQYKLPLALGNVEYMESASLSKEEKEILENNGFVITGGDWHDFSKGYKELNKRFPIFVTSDSVLHTYHLVFDTTLKKLEENLLYGEVENMTRYLLERSMQDYHSYSGATKEAAKRNVAFFSVAMKLLDQNFTVPNDVSDIVNKELARITEHKGFKPSVVFNSNPNCNPETPTCYGEDYSQYIPRGHYTQTEKLKRYFKAMMWYGRMAFFANPGIVSKRDANISTVQAQLIALHLGENTTALEEWNDVYQVTSFFVGTADDLTPLDYIDVMRSVYGDEVNPSDFAISKNLERFRKAITNKKKPKIYGGSGICGSISFGEKELEKCLNKTIGMRLMGQRLIPDSYILGRLVYPTVKEYTGNDEPFTLVHSGLGSIRGFPRGLDVMASLGSGTAKDILSKTGDTDYEGYWEALKNTTKYTESVDWNKNVYNAWLYSLKTLLTINHTGYPTFMQTQAWTLKDLKTVLGSWTELRHDTILYGKQSYTMARTLSYHGGGAEKRIEDGYVEPEIRLYSRMMALNNGTLEGLEALGVLDKLGRSGGDIRERFKKFGKLLERLTEISKKELKGQTLSKNDKSFISHFGENLESCTFGIGGKSLDTRIVADVHTDINSGKVLEEGLGNIDTIFVVYKDENKLKLGAGPVYSYYEFKHPMSDRLTDEKWRNEILENSTEVDFLQSIEPSCD